MIALAPRPGEHTLRTEDILDTIERQGSDIALVLFSGIQFYTGQYFAIKEITSAARTKVCRISCPSGERNAEYDSGLHRAACAAGTLRTE